MKNLIFRAKAFFVAHKIISIATLLVVGYAAFAIIQPRTQNASNIEVKRGSIASRVNIAGKVVPMKDLSLAFERSGRVVSVLADVGDKVGAGQAIVVLDQSDLLSQLAAMKANAAAEQARLDELARGTRPEELTIKQTAVDQAEQDLKNSYDNVLSTLEGAYLYANDSVRKQVSDLFVNPETSSPDLSFSTNDQQSRIDATTKRYLSSIELNNWRKELDTLYTGASANDLTLAISSAGTHLNVFRGFLMRTNDALTASVGLSSSLGATYKTDVTTAGTQIATAISNVSAISQTIKTKQLSLDKANNDLTLARAGSSKEVIDAQKARVDAAKANVGSTEASLSKTVLRAPIASVVTKQDAKIGQIVTPNVELVSLISADAFDVDANIPEIDIGKMAKGDRTDIVLDALPGETFSGKVISIDPAETLVDGAVNFKIKVAFDKIDPRLKSGFTANLSVLSEEKDGVLILPQYALKRSGNDYFAEKIEGKEAREVRVIVGVMSNDGMAEIVSGLSEGDEVVNLAKIAK